MSLKMGKVHFLHFSNLIYPDAPYSKRCVNQLLLKSTIKLLLSRLVGGWQEKRFSSQLQKEGKG